MRTRHGAPPRAGRNRRRPEPRQQSVIPTLIHPAPTALPGWAREPHLLDAPHHCGIATMQAFASTGAAQRSLEAASLMNTDRAPKPEAASTEQTSRLVFVFRVYGEETTGPMAPRGTPSVAILAWRARGVGGEPRSAACLTRSRSRGCCDPRSVVHPQACWRCRTWRSLSRRCAPTLSRELGLGSRPTFGWSLPQGKLPSGAALDAARLRRPW